MQQLPDFYLLTQYQTLHRFIGSVWDRDFNLPHPMLNFVVSIYQTQSWSLWFQFTETSRWTELNVDPCYFNLPDHQGSFTGSRCWTLRFQFTSIMLNLEISIYRSIMLNLEISIYRTPCWTLWFQFTGASCWTLRFQFTGARCWTLWFQFTGARCWTL